MPASPRSRSAVAAWCAIVALVVFIVVFGAIALVRDVPASTPAGYDAATRDAFVTNCAADRDQTTRAVCECAYDDASRTVPYERLVRYEGAVRTSAVGARSGPAGSVPAEIDAIVLACVAHTRLLTSPATATS